MVNVGRKKEKQLPRQGIPAIIVFNLFCYIGSLAWLVCSIFLISAVLFSAVLQAQGKGEVEVPQSPKYFKPERLEQEFKDLYFTRYCVPKNITSYDKCLEDVYCLFNGSTSYEECLKNPIPLDIISTDPLIVYSDIMTDLKRRAIQDYQEKFSYLNTEAIAQEDLNRYVKLADGGDIKAMFELYRYYKNPRSPDYSFYEVEANAWLLKAIKIGSWEAMLAKGYPRDYAKKTVVKSNDITASVISNCDPITAQSTTPQCFLYRLEIKPGQDEDGKNEDEDKVSYWTIIPEKNKDMDVSPIEISIVEQNGKNIIELISGDPSAKRQRKDYFSALGAYLGSDDPQWLPNYFYESRKALPLLSQVFTKTSKVKIITEQAIDKYPGYESFIIEEKKRQLLQEATFNPPFYATIDACPDLFLCFATTGNNNKGPMFKVGDKSNVPYLRKDEDALKKEIDIFKSDFGYHPLSMPNYIYYGNFEEVFKKAKTGDLYAIKILYDFYKNPLSFIHGEEFNEQRELVGEYFTLINRQYDLTAHPGLKNLLCLYKFYLEASRLPIKVKSHNEPYIMTSQAMEKDNIITLQVLSDSLEKLPSNSDGTCEDFDSTERYPYALKLTFGNTHDEKIASWVLINQPFHLGPYIEYDGGLLQGSRYSALVRLNLVDWNDTEVGGRVALSTWWGVDYFDIKGNYLGSNSSTRYFGDATLVPKDSPQKAMASKFVSPELRLPSLGSIRIDYNVFPSWEDVLSQIPQTSKEK